MYCSCLRSLAHFQLPFQKLDIQKSLAFWNVIWVAYLYQTCYICKIHQITNNSPLKNSQIHFPSFLIPPMYPLSSPCLQIIEVTSTQRNISLQTTKVHSCMALKWALREVRKFSRAVSVYEYVKLPAFKLIRYNRSYSYFSDVRMTSYIVYRGENVKVYAKVVYCACLTGSLAA